MSRWRAAKSRRVLAALLKIGWRIKRERATSHRVLEREGWADFVFAFHDGWRSGPECSLAWPADRFEPEDL